MLQKEAGDPWMRRISFWLVLLILVMGTADSAEAWFYQDPNPRVAVGEMPVKEDTTLAGRTMYIVKKGDTLLAIARKFQVNLEQLVNFNKLANPDEISIGQVLTIPAVGAGDRQPVVYQVKRGDTLWDIARLYGIDVDMLRNINMLKDPDQLLIGMRLVIPVGGGVSVPAGSMSLLYNTIASFNWPVVGIITSKFGRRWGEFHYGLDIAADMGTPVKAAAGGVVVASGWRGTYGQMVIIEHDQNYRTLYAHHSKLLVKEGDRVSPDQVIALVGSTGRSTGPHLHFEVHQNEKAMDPLRFLPGY